MKRDLRKDLAMISLLKMGGARKGDNESADDDSAKGMEMAAEADQLNEELFNCFSDDDDFGE